MEQSKQKRGEAQQKRERLSSRKKARDKHIGQQEQKQRMKD
jgi:hypothetical protein